LQFFCILAPSNFAISDRARFAKLHLFCSSIAPLLLLDCPSFRAFFSGMFLHSPAGNGTMSDLASRAKLTPLLLSQVLAMMEAAGMGPAPSPVQVAVELLRPIRLPEVVRLSGISEDTWRRRYRDKFIQLSQRAIGVRLIDVLLIGEENAVT
jgi:hypothetical protein